MGLHPKNAAELNGRRTIFVSTEILSSIREVVVALPVARATVPVLFVLPFNIKFRISETSLGEPPCGGNLRNTTASLLVAHLHQGQS
jgi:hypothetical protein